MADRRDTADDDVLTMQAEIAGLRASLAKSKRMHAFSVDHLRNFLHVKTVAELREVKGGAANWLARLGDVDKPS